MKHLFILVVTLSLFTACKKDVKPEISTSVKEIATTLPLKYAKGFSITNYSTYKEILVTSAWPKSTETFRYLIVNENEKTPAHSEKDVSLFNCLLKKLVVMSTTNIPSLEYLGVDDKLVGFPSTDYISSEKTKTRVDNGEIKDLNNDLEINMELLLELQPELVIGFSVNGNNKSLDQIEKFGIPIVYDGAWTEESPLGRAEWIKFIAAFFNKEKQAETIFNDVEKSYFRS